MKKDVYDERFSKQRPEKVGLQTKQSEQLLTGLDQRHQGIPEQDHGQSPDLSSDSGVRYILFRNIYKKNIHQKI